MPKGTARAVRVRRIRAGIDPGFSREARDGGFRYLDARGRPAGVARAAAIDALVIPPAWTQVWIAADERGHIQAMGIDEAGRRQYLYHPGWSDRRAKAKYRRALELAAALPRARARATTALGRPDMDRERVLAIAFRILDLGALRIGSRRYLLRYGSRGLTTLRRADVTVDGAAIVLAFPAKSGVAAHVEIVDEPLARALTELGVGRGRALLLAYRTGRRRFGVSPAEVNAHVRALTGGAFTAKDFRTLRGTIAAAASLAAAGEGETRKSAERAAVAAAAAALGNTVSVARASYIDPRVWEAYGRGALLDLTVTPESAIRSLLAAPGAVRP